MREPEMFEPMINYLKKEGYAILQVNRGNRPGPDILAKKAGRQLVIQMKGDSAAIKTDWDTGLGQLLDTMDDPGADYGMAVSESYKRLARRLSPYVRNRLRLIFFVVKDGGEVVELP